MNRFVRRHWWWIVSSFVLAGALGFAVGYSRAWIGYAVFNNIGVWLAVDHHRFGPRARRSWMAWSAAALLPVGPIGLFVTGSGMTPTEISTTGSHDEGVREETARAMSQGVSGPFGSM